MVPLLNFLNCLFTISYYSGKDITLSIRGSKVSTSPKDEILAFWGKTCIAFVLINIALTYQIEDFPLKDYSNCVYKENLK
jgi:hypothetical protein